MIQQIIAVLQQQVDGISFVNLFIICIWSCVLVGIAILIRVLCFHMEYSWLTINMWLSLTVYFCVLMFLTLGNREFGGTYASKWIPFNQLMMDNGEPNVVAWILAGFNLTLFIPFGVIVTILQKKIQSKRRILYVLLESFFLSTMIEIIQGLVGLGYFETEDIILNTLGGMIGCGISNLTIILLRRYRDNSLYF